MVSPFSGRFRTIECTGNSCRGTIQEDKVCGEHGELGGSCDERSEGGGGGEMEWERDILFTQCNDELRAWNKILYKRPHLHSIDLLHSNVVGTYPQLGEHQSSVHTVRLYIVPPAQQSQHLPVWSMHYMTTYPEPWYDDMWFCKYILSWSGNW